jgi:hypothetical protein
LSSGCSGFDNAIGVVDEHRLSTNGPAAPCGCSAAWCPVAPDADLGVGVIEIFFPGPMRKPATRGQEEFPDEKGVRAFAPPARSWQPRRHRNTSFRPVALRPRLSTGLPLSLQGVSVKASRMTVKHLYCGEPLREQLHISIRSDMLNCLGAATDFRPFVSPRQGDVLLISPVRTH